MEHNFLTSSFCSLPSPVNMLHVGEETLRTNFQGAGRKGWRGCSKEIAEHRFPSTSRCDFHTHIRPFGSLPTIQQSFTVFRIRLDPNIGSKHRTGSKADPLNAQRYFKMHAGVSIFEWYPESTSISCLLVGIHGLN